jgi:hypothetical protein
MTTDKPRSARSQIKERFDKANMRITLVSTLVAVIAAGAGLWTAYEARQSRIEDERPFIAVDFAPEPDEANLPHLVDKLHFFNTQLVSTGRSPARQIQFLCGMISPPRDGPAGLKWPLAGLDARQFITLPYLLPGHTQQVSCQQVPNFADPEKNEDITALIRLGQVNYQDQYAKSYCTPFCVVIHERGSAPISADPCRNDLKSYGLCDLK